MRFAFYCGVVLVAAASVVFGLDWMSAPMPPMPDVKNVVFVPPPPPPPPRVVQAPTPQPSAPANPVRPPVAANEPASMSAPSAGTPPSGEVAAAPPVAAAPRPKCDVVACEAAYRSFRESDCTYNPSFGPRRLCTKGDPERYAREHPEPAPATPAAAPVAPAAEPGSIIAPEPGTTAAPESPATSAPRCNVGACAASYPRSFREADCTFQPNFGPRRVCEK